MKFESNIFYELARAIGLSSPDIHGTTIDIPPLLNGMIEPRKPLDVFGLNATGVKNETSFSTSFFLDQNASAVPQNVLTATIGPGLWEFFVMGASTSNYINTGQFFDQYVTLDDVSQFMIMLGFNAGGVAAAPSTVTAYAHFKVLLSEKNVVMRGVTNGNLAAQRMTTSFSIVACKLL